VQKEVECIYDELKQKLDAVPQQLEGYLEKIMSGPCKEPSLERNKTEMQEAARIFLVAIEANSPLPVLALHSLSTELRDPDYALRFDREAMTDTEVTRLEKL